MTHSEGRTSPTHKRLLRTKKPALSSGHIPSHWWLGFLATLLALVLAPLAISEYNLTLLTAYALLALSLAFTWGIAGILCFGQAAFYGLGAYSISISIM